MADVLTQTGVPVLLVDIYPGALDQARALKLSVLQAEILSEQGTEALDGRAVDYVLATTPDDIYNGLVCARLAPELGMQHVLQLAPERGRLDLRRGLSRDSRGKVLGDASWNYAMFEEHYRRGWRFFVRAIEDEEALMSSAPGQIEVLIIRKHGQLIFPSVEDEVAFSLGPGDRAVSFIDATEDILTTRSYHHCSS
jgi:TrkA-N domain